MLQQVVVNYIESTMPYHWRALLRYLLGKSQLAYAYIPFWAAYPVPTSLPYGWQRPGPHKL